MSYETKQFISSIYAFLRNGKSKPCGKILNFSQFVLISKTRNFLQNPEIQLYLEPKIKSIHFFESWDYCILPFEYIRASVRDFYYLIKRNLHKNDTFF